MRWTKALIEQWAENYSELKEYEILPWEVEGAGIVRGERKFTAPFETQAIMNADFDTALDRLGKGHWTGGLNREWRDFRYFGRLQRLVIAKIYGFEDWELEAIGFYDIPRLRGTAYRWMLDYLNG